MSCVSIRTCGNGMRCVSACIRARQGTNKHYAEYLLWTKGNGPDGYLGIASKLNCWDWELVDRTGADGYAINGFKSNRGSEFETKIRLIMIGHWKLKFNVKNFFKRHTILGSSRLLRQRLAVNSFPSKFTRERVMVSCSYHYALAAQRHVRSLVFFCNSSCHLSPRKDVAVDGCRHPPSVYLRWPLSLLRLLWWCDVDSVNRTESTSCAQNSSPQDIPPTSTFL